MIAYASEYGISEVRLLIQEIILLSTGASNFYSSKCGKAKNSEICEDFVNGQKEFVEVLKKVKMNIFGTGDILVRLFLMISGSLTKSHI